MGFLMTLLMGLIVGSITGFLMKTSYPWYVDILLGLLGAGVGGWLSGLLLGADLTSGFNLTSMVVAVIGAVIVVSLVRLVTNRR